VFDGTVVTWNDPDAGLVPGRDRREYVFVIKPRTGVQLREVQTTAWAEFARPVPGVSMSEKVAAGQPIVRVADAAGLGRVWWTGEWSVSRNVADYFGDAYQVHRPGDGSFTYTWEVDLDESGTYEVSAWWTEGPDRAGDARYSIHSRAGTGSVRLSQRERGSRWVSLGRYDFDAGSARVVLTDDANGVVIADAIRLRKQ
jgi:hypothetical protein